MIKGKLNIYHNFFICIEFSSNQNAFHFHQLQLASFKGSPPSTYNAFNKPVFDVTACRACRLLFGYDPKLYIPPPQRKNQPYWFLEGLKFRTQPKMVELRPKNGTTKEMFFKSKILCQEEQLPPFEKQTNPIVYSQMSINDSHIT